jgi:hypothetical protein
MHGEPDESRSALCPMRSGNIRKKVFGAMAGVHIRRAYACKDAELKTILARFEATEGFATVNRSISRLLQQILVD